MGSFCLMAIRRLLSLGTARKRPNEAAYQADPALSSKNHHISSRIRPLSHPAHMEETFVGRAPPRRGNIRLRDRPTPSLRPAQQRHFLAGLVPRLEFQERRLHAHLD